MEKYLKETRSFLKRGDEPARILVGKTLEVIHKKRIEIQEVQNVAKEDAL